MKSVLDKLFLFRKYICIYSFFYFFTAIVAAQGGGFLYLKFLCYQNPENKLANGQFCDEYHPDTCYTNFTICISTQNIKEEIKEEKCNVYQEQTRIFHNNDLICNNPDGRINYLGIDIQQQLSLPIQKTYFVRVEADHYNYRESLLIASFGAEFSQVPSAKVVFKDMVMNRTDVGYANPGVGLNIAMALQCVDNDPQCYSNNNPCSNHPCKNDGICTPKKDGEGYDCQCKKPFSGPQCDNKTDSCELKPCKNNGTCHLIKPDTFRCECPQGFKGTFCEQKTSDLNSSQKILLLVFGTFVILLLIVFTACFITKRYLRRNKQPLQNRIDENQMSEKELERQSNSLREIADQNLNVLITEMAYEEIDERYTYGSLLDKNDDYLVPDCINTLSSDPLQTHNSDYLEMSVHDDTLKNQSKEVLFENENDYLPPLPPRELKKM